MRFLNSLQLNKHLSQCFLGSIGHTPSILLLENNMCLKGIAFTVEDVVQVVDDARAAQFQYGFLHGPEGNERGSRIFGSVDGFQFLVVHCSA